MQPILEVKDLQKSYGDIAAVRGISFTMKEGSLLAFLGPNGAGKSTSIHMITTFLQPDHGSVVIGGYHLGEENHQIRHLIGTVFQEGCLDGALSIEENLRVRCSLYQMRGKAIHEAVERVCTLCELHELRKRKYRELSGGQKRRCDIARALLHTPKLLFLDEPTTGLDPKTRAMIWNVIRRLQKEEGMSVFLTTHYMEEAKDADEVIVLKQGLIQAQGTPADLKRTYAQNYLRLYGDLPKMSRRLQAEGLPYQKIGECLVLTLTHTKDAMSLLARCQDCFDDFEVVLGTMDDAFLAIIQAEVMA